MGYGSEAVSPTLTPVHALGLPRQVAIASGSDNCIMNLAKIHSFIGSGCNNIVEGSFSSVLTGCRSCDNGFDYAGVFGCAVVAQAANTFHVECLNAVNTPTYVAGPGFPSGTIFKYTGGALPAGALPLYIMP